MQIEYIGKKNELAVQAPYLSKAYGFEKGTPLDVDSDDGVLLLDLFPAIFLEVAEPGPGTDDRSGKQNDDDKKDPPPDDDEDFTFELDPEGTSFLCPLCDKTYKVNQGRGKFALISHLESAHAEEWQAMKSTPKEE